MCRVIFFMFLPIVSHLIITTTLSDRDYCYSHLTGRELRLPEVKRFAHGHTASQAAVRGFSVAIPTLCGCLCLHKTLKPLWQGSCPSL